MKKILAFLAAFIYILVGGFNIQVGAMMISDTVIPGISDSETHQNAREFVHQELKELKSPDEQRQFCAEKLKKLKTAHENLGKRKIPGEQGGYVTGLELLESTYGFDKIPYLHNYKYQYQYRSPDRHIVSRCIINALALYEKRLKLMTASSLYSLTDLNERIHEIEFEFVQNQLASIDEPNKQRQFCDDMIIRLEEAWESLTNITITDNYDRLMEGFKILYETYSLAKIPYIRHYEALLPFTPLALSCIENALNLYMRVINTIPNEEGYKSAFVSGSDHCDANIHSPEEELEINFPYFSYSHELYKEEFEFAKKKFRRLGFISPSKQYQYCTQVKDKLEQTIFNTEAKHKMVISPTDKRIPDENGNLISGLRMLDKTFRIAELPFLRHYNLVVLSKYSNISYGCIRNAIVLYTNVAKEIESNLMHSNFLDDPHPNKKQGHQK